MDGPFFSNWLWVGGQNERSAKIEDSLSQGRRNSGAKGAIPPSKYFGRDGSKAFEFEFTTWPLGF